MAASSQDTSTDLKASQDFTKFLADFVYMTVRFGDLFHEDEDLVHSCREANTPANQLENAGDHWICQGPGLDVIEKILQGLPVDLDAGLLSEAARWIGEYLVGNVTFGTYASTALQLDRCFRYQPGLHWTNEMCAGLFEMMIGLLHREGRHLLLKHILMWCVGCMLMMLSHERLITGGGMEFLQRYHNEAYTMSTLLGAHSLPIRIGDPRFVVLELACGFADAIWRSWFNMCLRESGGCGNEAASESIVPLSVFDEGPPKRGAVLKNVFQCNAVSYYLELRCYEPSCSNTAETTRHPDCISCYEEAKALGWGKPSTTAWSHARCPNHNWSQNQRSVHTSSSQPPPRAKCVSPVRARSGGRTDPRRGTGSWVVSTVVSPPPPRTTPLSPPPSPPPPPPRTAPTSRTRSRPPPPPPPPLPPPPSRPVPRPPPSLEPRPPSNRRPGTVEEEMARFPLLQPATLYF
jgi:hypothetical protein